MHTRGKVNEVISKSSGRTALFVGTAACAGAAAPNGWFKPKKMNIFLFLTKQDMLIKHKYEPPPIGNVGAAVVVVAAPGNPNPVKGAGAEVVVGAPNENAGAAVLAGAPNAVKSGRTVVVAAVAVDAGVPKLNAGAALVPGVVKLNDVAGFVVPPAGAPNKVPVGAAVVLVGVPNVNGFAVVAVVVVPPAGVPKSVGLVAGVAPNENAI